MKHLSHPIAITHYFNKYFSAEEKEKQNRINIF